MNNGTPLASLGGNLLAKGRRKAPVMIARQTDHGPLHRTLRTQFAPLTSREIGRHLARYREHFEASTSARERDEFRKVIDELAVELSIREISLLGPEQ